MRARAKPQASPADSRIAQRSGGSRTISASSLHKRELQSVGNGGHGRVRASVDARRNRAKWSCATGVAKTRKANTTLFGIFHDSKVHFVNNRARFGMVHGACSFFGLCTTQISNLHHLRSVPGQRVSRVCSGAGKRPNHMQTKCRHERTAMHIKRCYAADDVQTASSRRSGNMQSKRKRVLCRKIMLSTIMSAGLYHLHR